MKNRFYLGFYKFMLDSEFYKMKPVNFNKFVCNYLICKLNQWLAAVTILDNHNPEQGSVVYGLITERSS